jgi:hypothetical protein
MLLSLELEKASRIVGIIRIGDVDDAGGWLPQVLVGGGLGLSDGLDGLFDVLGLVDGFGGEGEGGGEEG